MNTVRHADFSPAGMPHGECPNCGFIAWCLPANLTSHESKQFNALVKHRHLIKRNEYLHRAGSALTSLFVINSGALKTSMADDAGREQITGFSMVGEMVGMDAIGDGKHQCDTIALEDTYLCGITYSDFERLTREIPAVQHHFHRAMSGEIARDHGIMLLLGAMRAEERLAMFLLNLSKRYAARGYSGTNFKLPMTRQDIGSYLGLKLETISRTLSHFSNIQIVAVHNRNIEIKSLLQLQQIVGVDNTHRSSLLRTQPGN